MAVTDSKKTYKIMHQCGGSDEFYTPEHYWKRIIDFYQLNEEECYINKLFYPGGNYEQEIKNGTMPKDKVIVDNPPFSIISKICKTLDENGYKFILQSGLNGMFAITEKTRQQANIWLRNFHWWIGRIDGRGVGKYIRPDGTKKEIKFSCVDNIMPRGEAIYEKKNETKIISLRQS